MSTIKVKTGHGRVDVEAEIHGKFAVHPVLIDSELWSVTHIASGLSVEQLSDEKKAVRLARKLDEEVTVDITPERIYSEEYKAFARAVRAVVRKDGAEQEPTQ